MKNKDFIHLPELYLKFGILKNHLKKLYKLKLIPMESKEVMQFELTEDVQDKIEEKLESRFLNLHYLIHLFGEIEDPEFDYSTPITDEAFNHPQVSVTFRTIEGAIVEEFSKEQYDALKKEINKWAIPNGLTLIGIFQHKGSNEISISFTIHDVEKAITDSVPIINPIDKYVEIIDQIEDRLQKVSKHIKQHPVDQKWFSLIEKTLVLVEGIEQGIDNDLKEPADSNAQKKKIPVKKSIAILSDKDGKVIERMEVSFATEEYAKSAFAAAKINVRPLDKITFED